MVSELVTVKIEIRTDLKACPFCGFYLVTVDSGRKTIHRVNECMLSGFTIRTEWIETWQDRRVDE